MEVYKYKVTTYDPHTREGSLFVDCINTYLKLKDEASGYPAWVRNPEKEERYVTTFKAREGMLMDRDAIRPNAAKRSLEKLCLNSLWGKLAERQNRNQTNLIFNPQELYRFLATTGFEVVSFMFATDRVVWASWRYTAEQQAPSLRHNNEVVAAYVACGGRRHLYSYLDKLGERAFYCNTDIVIFMQKTD